MKSVDLVSQCIVLSLFCIVCLSFAAHALAYEFLFAIAPDSKSQTEK